MHSLWTRQQGGLGEVGAGWRESMRKKQQQRNKGDICHIYSNKDKLEKEREREKPNRRGKTE